MMQCSVGSTAAFCLFLLATNVASFTGAPSHFRGIHSSCRSLRAFDPVHALDTTFNLVSTASETRQALEEVALRIASTSTSLADAPPEAGGISYSKASYYTVLALYLMSFPGLWSTIKRSTSAKVKSKTFVTPGTNAPNGKALRDQAGEIMACKFVQH